MRSQFFLLFILIGASLSLHANKSMIVKDYTTDDGLPHNSVYGTFKDANGLMWFATWYGLTSFDGVKFRSYNNRDDYNTDIPPHKLQTVKEANDGNIWVKTVDHRLFLFDKKHELYYDVFNQIKLKYSVSPKIIKIQHSENGELLLLTLNKDLLKAVSKGNGKIDVSLLYDSQVKRNTRRTGNLLIEDNENLSWIGVDFKIISVRKGDVLSSKPSDFLTRKIGLPPTSEFTCAYLFRNILWLGDNAGNLYKVDYMNGNVQKFTVLAGSALQKIITLNGKNVFVGIKNQGVFEFDDRNMAFDKVISLNVADAVTNAYLDSYDKLWFEINQSAIVYYDPLNGYQKRFSIGSGKVNRDIVVQDGNELGMFFLSTSGDITLFNRVTYEVSVLNAESQLLRNGERITFFNILLDSDNILWLTSTNNGIFRISFPKQQFSVINLKTSSVGSLSIKCMYQARNSDIWVATRDSEVLRLDRNGNIKQVFSSKNYDIGNVYHFMEDASGNIWFSTKGNGLVVGVEDSKSPYGYQFTRYKYDEGNNNSLSGNEVYYTYQDSKGRIWVGLFGGGLNLMSQENGKTIFLNKYNSFDNYPKYGQYMEVRNITEDANGRIWVGTSDGLMSFDVDFKLPNQIDFEIYRNDVSGSNVSDNDVYVLYKDSQSQIWVSVFGGGLSKMVDYDAKNRRPVFKSFSIKEGLNSDVILSIVEDDNNALWIATENSIARFDKEKETFRNFDRYDGLPYLQMEEESVLKSLSGEVWFGSRNGILVFNPDKIETYNYIYQTVLVDFLVSNRELRSFKDKPILRESIRYATSIKLKHDQSTFLVEFAALNYFNPNRVNYRYILEGFEEEWHYNGRNRIASYPNVPHGKYRFRVQSLDEVNAGIMSERVLEIIILPPWWKSWWAYCIYSIFALLLIYAGIKAFLFYIKMRNDVYIEQRVSELKIRFFTNISHELRTPLTLIMGPIQELKQKQKLDDKGQQYMALIEKSANQMLQLVNQILDFRKIQNGKMVLHVSKVELNKLVDSLRKEFEVLSEEKEISFSSQLADQEIMLWADKEKLEIVIRNILSNAFKFTQAGGSIFVTTGLSEDKLRCYVKVEDTGIGIPQNKLSEIFERFSQGESSKNAYYQGTGIGLALSKEIVSLHHGEITADGKPDIGSVFTIELMLGKEHFKPNEVNFYVDDADSVELSNAASPIEGALSENDDEEDEDDRDIPTLLVVEDNKDLCALLKLQLEDRYKVYIASNGVEGLRKINHYHPDIVVTDQMMPEMSGTEMLQHIRNDFRISHIPVIILTAKNNEEDKIKAINMGANAYITKPFNKEYLIARVEQLLSDRKVFRDRIWNQDETKEQQENDTYETYLVKKDVQLLEKINQVIEENLHNSDYNIDAIAETLGLSRSAFFKKLKSLTGLAPVDLIKEIRLNKSIELLKNTDMTISEVAFAVGFKEAGYYGKCFRKKYNQTPTEFMNKYRKA